MTNEIWKDIPEYEGLYQVSSLGRVKSLSRSIRKKNGYRTTKERILKPSFSNEYCRVLLSNGLNKKHYSIHRLVAAVFLINANNLPCIDHIDGVRANNNVNNLRWCTHKENSNYTVTKKRQKEAKKGYKIPVEVREKAIKTISKPVEQIDRVTGERISIYSNAKEAERDTGINAVGIYYSCSGKRKTSGGFIWRYI